MKKILILPFLFLILALGCGKEEMKRPEGTDFEALMGKGLPRWEFVQTKEDFENLAFFKALYEKNIVHLSLSKESYRIPKTLHYIWLGPKPFPLESVSYVRSWLGKHPSWTVYFWTDRDRPLPHPSMKARSINDLNWELEALKSCYDKSDNWGEKSDILRLEILSQEGGIYVDHDVKCLSAFDPLNCAFDLYCGMEMPYKTALESSLFPTNNIVAARKSHPLLTRCKEWLIANWAAIERAYPGTDRDSVINRVSHRTFYVLGKHIKEGANQEGNRDIALPAFYFNAPKEEWGLFAQHKYAGTWFENESKFEKTTRERLMHLSKKSNQILRLGGLLFALNLLGFGALFVLIFRKR